MMDSAATKLVENLVTLPTIPDVLAKLNTVITDPDSSAKEIADVVCSDQSIAAKVLRIANSSFYGARTRVTSIQNAVSILGTKVLRNLVLQATTIRAFSHLKDSEYFGLNEFWTHSVEAAIAAQVLAQAATKFTGKPDECYAMGLIHDIGKVILLDCMAEKFLLSAKRAQELGGDSVTAEQEVFGFDHCKVGEILAIRWKLPEELSQGILHHHQSPLEMTPHMVHACLVYLANQFVDNLQIFEGMEVAQGLHPVALDLVGIPVERTPELAEELCGLTASIEF